MKQLFVCGCALATLILVVGAYNFDDPDYNQVLADELEDLYNLPVDNGRFRREADGDKCRRRKHRLCCAEELLEKLHSENKGIRAECFKEITGKDKPEKPTHHGRPFDPFDCKKMEERRNDMLCIHQCFGQKLKFIDADGNIKPDEFGTYIKGILAEAKYLQPVQDKIITGCLGEIKNATANTKSNGKCKVAGIVSDFCIFKNIQLNCPEDQMKDKEMCLKMQERIKQGKELFEPPPPPPAGKNMI